jgi:integrase
MEQGTFKPSKIQFKINIKFNLRNTEPKNKVTPVRCIVRFNNEKVVLPSPVKIEPRYWNPNKQEARNNQRMADGTDINLKINDVKKEIEGIFNTYIKKFGKFPAPDNFKQLVLKELSTEKNNISSTKVQDLLTFIEQMIPDMESGKRQTQKGSPFAENSIKIFRTLKSNIEDFKSKYNYDLDFQNINFEFFEDWKEYMIFELDYSTNTVAKHIRVLKTIITDAYERNLTTYQFIGNKFKATTELTDTIYLNEVELLKLYELDLSQNLKLDKIRDLFILGCWTGLRFSDYSDISPRDIQGHNLKIRTQKTKQVVVIPILQYVQKILTKYKGKTENNLPPSISNQKMNEYLKELGKSAGFEEIIQQEFTKGGKSIIKNSFKYALITTHTARRSFATNMYKAGVPTLSIMAITGHKTETSFMKYIRVNSDEHADIVRDLYSARTLKVVND